MDCAYQVIIVSAVSCANGIVIVYKNFLIFRGLYWMK